MDWYRWGPADERAVRCAIAHGFTEADVRDVRQCVYKDVMQIRMHNWRKLRVSGWEYFTSMIPKGSTNINYHDGRPRPDNRGYNPTPYVTWQPPR